MRKREGVLPRCLLVLKKTALANFYNLPSRLKHGVLAIFNNLPSHLLDLNKASRWVKQVPFSLRLLESTPFKITAFIYKDDAMTDAFWVWTYKSNQCHFTQTHTHIQKNVETYTFVQNSWIFDRKYPNMVKYYVNIESCFEWRTFFSFLFNDLVSNLIAIYVSDKPSVMGMGRVQQCGFFFLPFFLFYNFIIIINIIAFICFSQIEPITKADRYI